MREVIACGGFGTSVTPLSQFYFQQAFKNVINKRDGNDRWATITPGYGKMVLGYFGKPPMPPNSLVVKRAEEQLKIQRNTYSVVELNDRNPNMGISYNKSLLEKAGLPASEENIFIVATCEEKGMQYLKGNRPCGIRYKEISSHAASKNINKSYTVNVNGKPVVVELNAADGNYIAMVDGQSFNVTINPFL